MKHRFKKNLVKFGFSLTALIIMYWLIHIKLSFCQKTKSMLSFHIFGHCYCYLEKDMHDKDQHLNFEFQSSSDIIFIFYFTSPILSSLSNFVKGCCNLLEQSSSFFFLISNKNKLFLSLINTIIYGAFLANIIYVVWSIF